jgi:alpha,alpha-trehalase
VYAEHLPYLLAEYRFWMKGTRKLKTTEYKAIYRVAQVAPATYLNRYYDSAATPRPESLREDETTAERSQRIKKDRVYLHLRAAAESGWDFSSRWFLDPHDITTIHTADILPVDLNCLLYQLETTIAACYQSIKNPLLQRKFERLASKRADAIQKFCWDDKAKFFVDYNFHQNLPTGRLTLAAVFPLFSNIATPAQAVHVAERLERDFLRSGGLVTTLINSGEQWDAPNGWAPLQWVAIQGLRNYGFAELANEIKKRWIAVNLAVYTSHYKLVEKYNVEDSNALGGGGEYPLQDGFGWTNGVLAALLAEQ